MGSKTFSISSECRCRTSECGIVGIRFAAGVELMRRDRPDILYLSTTDYIQHKHAQVRRLRMTFTP